jgi:putative tryptophan/tyrosine transport system substrate-binding protein
MRRRQFLGVIGASAIAWPLAARAQQPEQMRHIGVLVGLAPDENGQAAIGFLRAFRDAMQQSGWIEGKNIRIDYRFGGMLADLARTNASAARRSRNPPIAGDGRTETADYANANPPYRASSGT